MNRMMKRMERILGDCKALTGILKDEIKELKKDRQKESVSEKHVEEMMEIYREAHESAIKASIDNLCNFGTSISTLRPMTGEELSESYKLFDVFTHSPGMAMGEDDEPLKDWQDYSKSAGQAYETDSISKSHSYDGGCNAVDETVCEAKPPIDLIPFAIWIDLRRQEIIQKQAAAIENLEGFKDVWIYELQFLTKMLKKYNR